MEKTYLISKEQYLKAKKTWASKNNHEAFEMIIYNLLRSKPLNNGFCEKKSNIQGNDPWYAYHQALSGARWYITKPNLMKSIFGFVLPEQFKELIKE